MLRAARVAGEQRFESAARLAYVPRCRRWSKQVQGYPMPIGYGIGYDAGIKRLETHINALRTMRSVSINGAAMAAGDLANLTSPSGARSTSRRAATGSTARRSRSCSSTVSISRRRRWPRRS